MRMKRRDVLRAVPVALGSNVFLRGRAFGEVRADEVPKPNTSSMQNPAKEETSKETVSGIGGFFFRSHDPKALGEWYKEHLGIPLTPTKMDDPVWKQEAGTTIFSPFPQTTKYFGNPEKMWMINFRVRNLVRLVEQLKAAQIEVKVYPADATGQFAHLNDPEGNPIELWQPAGGC